MKKYILIPIIVCIIIFGYLTGMYIYKINELNEKNKKIELAKQEIIEDECTAEYEYMSQLQATSAQEEKISPNAKIISNIYYNMCGHTIKDVDTIQQEYINLTKEELAEIYKDWEIESFSKDEIVLKKTQDGICKEHYVVKEKDGYLAIYSLDENEKETLENITEISIQFLPNTDLEKLRTGIRAYGKESLNSLLEDFE